MRKIYFTIFLGLIFSRFLFSQEKTEQISDNNDTILHFNMKDQAISGELLRLLPVNDYRKASLLFAGISNYNIDTYGIFGITTDNNAIIIDGIIIEDASGFPFSFIKNFAFDIAKTSVEFNNSTTGFLHLNTPDYPETIKFNIDFSESPLKGYSEKILDFDLGGPLKIMKSDKYPHFYISGRYTNTNTFYPTYISSTVVKPDVLEEITENPIMPTSTGMVTSQSADYLTASDLTTTSFFENTGGEKFNLYSKISIPLGNKFSIDLGNYTKLDNSKVFIYENALMNSVNNPELITRNTDIYARINHQIYKSGNFELGYELKLNYSNYYRKQQSPVHQDNFFNYGYIGKFKTHKIRSYQLFGIDTIAQNMGLPYEGQLHDGFRDTLVEFEASDINSELFNYTSTYYSLYDNNFYGQYANFMNIENGGGLLNGIKPSMIYQMWNVPGYHHDFYGISSREKYDASLLLKASYKKHEIVFGGSYTKRDESKYEINPYGLWTLARNLANNHILELDYHNPMPVYDDNGVYQGIINYNRLYNANAQSLFDIKLREKLGLPIDGLDWIDIDNLDPSLFTIDMFSANELFNSGYSYVYYQGYDPYGNKIKDDPTLDDFFNLKDEYGNYVRPKPAYEPVNKSAFINYIFNNKWISTNIGLRVESFNSNQYMLKDPYLLCPAKTAGEVNEFGQHPSNIEDDFVVYVDNSSNPTEIKGYRDEDVWYNSAGEEINDPSIIYAATGNVAPYLIDPDVSLGASSFTETESIINILPRINISIQPLRGLKLFTSYNSYTQNPEITNRFIPEQYMFIYTNNFINNPRLEPQRINNFETGITCLFKSYFMGEIRFNDIRLLNTQMLKVYNGAYPIKYYTIVNSGEKLKNKAITASAQFMIGKNPNVLLRINYTWMLKNDIIETVRYDLYPTINELIAYTNTPDEILNNYLIFTFGKGQNYIGPNVKFIEKTIENLSMGISLTYNGYLIGEPEQTDVYPWSAKERIPSFKYVDLKINKEVVVSKIAMNFYFIIENYYNEINIYSVYATTGSTNDSGYLSYPGNQSTIQSQHDPDSYRLQRSIYENNPLHYASPRLFRLGLSFSF